MQKFIHIVSAWWLFWDIWLNSSFYNIVSLQNVPYCLYLLFDHVSVVIVESIINCYRGWFPYSSSLSTHFCIAWIAKHSKEHVICVCYLLFTFFYFLCNQMITYNQCLLISFQCNEQQRNKLWDQCDVIVCALVSYILIVPVSSTV